MTQKIIKVGTSAVVTIPKDIMEKYDWKIGDAVEVALNDAEQSLKISSSKGRGLSYREVIEWTDNFIKRYHRALEALARK